MVYNNNVDIINDGTDTILLGDNTVYGAGWNGDLGTATKNAIWDKVELHEGDAEAHQVVSEVVTYTGDGAIDHDIATTVNTVLGFFTIRGATGSSYFQIAPNVSVNSVVYEYNLNLFSLSANNIRLETNGAPLNANGIAYRMIIWGVG